ncbi:MAG: energy-coupled thiamine transporter ThiT [Nitrososphaerota archaeon]|jgi:thiamine transporter|nr:energy-coupled thiamine transporter ThiT [Nitrososphaerota archaeon]
MSTTKKNILKVKPIIRTHVLAEIVIFIALGTALSIATRFMVFPQGGSITVGAMVPILWLSLRRGPKIGIFTGVIYGLVQLAIDPMVVYPTQVLLDYPLAYGCLGFAGFFKNLPVGGVVGALMGRFVMHLFSGAIFFANLTPGGMSPWIYSALYNGSYMLPELVISICFIYLLQKSKVLGVYM